MDSLKRRLGWTAWDLGLGAAVGLASGAASAAFLLLLARVIGCRQAHPWLLYLLPLFGLASAGLYRRWGREAEAGGALILDEVIEFRGRVPSRMAPLVFAGALLSHLGGASVGREGVAVQMGASLARTLGKLRWPWLRLTRSRQRLLLMAGMAGGFGSLFGTPAAGALFGLEAIAIGKVHYEGLVICAVASFVGDGLARRLGIVHEAFAPPVPPWSLPLAGKLLLFALPVALVAALFSEVSHGLARWTKARLPRWWARPLVGGALFVLLALAFREDAYLNLGLPWLERVFQGGPIPAGAFALKFLLTVLVLGFGFKGGEVTPLFVIGALLGAACAPLLGLPAPFLGAVGFVTLFAAASNTPLTSLVLGVELFGAPLLPSLAAVGFLAYVLVGHRGIYGARVGTPKPGETADPG